VIPRIGHTVNGARLWLRVGPFSFQPGEAAKVMLVLFMASYMSERRELLALPRWRPGAVAIPDPKYLAPLFGMLGLSLLVFVRQNDLGSSLLFFLTFLAILWIGTGRPICPISGLILFAFGVWVALHIFGHVRVRFEAWLDP